MRNLLSTSLIAFALLFSACAEEQAYDADTATNEGVGAEEGIPMGQDPSDTGMDAIGTNYYTDWDMDANAELTEDEFGTGFRTGTWWNDWDLDDDTYLSEEEYNSAFANEAWYDAGFYNTWDADGDGSLSQDEWEAGLFGEWDANDDTFLAEDEYDTGLFD